MTYLSEIYWHGPTTTCGQFDAPRPAPHFQHLATSRLTPSRGLRAPFLLPLHSGGRQGVLRFIYLGRLSLASAIFLAALTQWGVAERASTLIATLAFTLTLFFTVASMVFADGPERTPNTTFYYVQSLFDLLLVTAVVHLTRSAAPSVLAPLYILLIAVAALMLPPKGVLLIAALGDVLYFADTLITHQGGYDASVTLQLGVFGAVALGCGAIGMRLRRAEAGTEAMAAELAAFRVKQADVELLHTRAERLEAVAELSASLAHEIKNPLASIRSAAELLAKMPAANSDTRTLTELVERESDRLSRLLSEFLDFARTGVTRVRRIDIVEVVRNAALLADGHPGKPDGVRIVQLFPSTSLIVVGDEDLLHRAIFNLLLNAVEASSPNGEVVVEGGELARQQLPPQGKAFSRGALMLKVTDHGSGIPAEVRDNLFEPFVSTKMGGNGLGLSVAHRAVEAHHGFILTESDSSGTRMSVVLPKLSGSQTPS